LFASCAALLGGIGPDVRTFQVAYGVGFIGYLILGWAVTRCRCAATLGPWKWWLIGCVALRVLLLATSSGDDTYRYLWEGRIQLAGFNPFGHPPNDPQLAHLRDDAWSKINHPDYPAIYGPVAELHFLAASAVYPSAVTLKVVHVVCDILVIAVLAAGLRRLNRPPHRAVLYGLCPLVLTAFGIEGHLDSVMLLFVALAVWAMIARRPGLAAVMVGLAIATKIVCIVLLPGLILGYRRLTANGRSTGMSRPHVGPTGKPACWWQAGLVVQPVAIVVIIAALCYAPYMTAGTGLFSSLLRFAAADEFFSMLGAFSVTSFESGSARWIVVSVLASILLLLALRRSEFATYAAGAVQAILILMPVVHYWYLSWVMVFAPFGVRLRWIAAAMAMVVYFEAELGRQATGVWSMPPWAPLVVWLTFSVVWLTVDCRPWIALRRAPNTDGPSELHDR
jgi:hypothetical protein